MKMGKNMKQEKSLTFTEGVAMLVGTNIGIGILSIVYIAKDIGFFPLFFWLFVAFILNTITMLYIAETSLRTKEHLQLSGLSEKYIGKIGKAIMFISIAATCIGALIAYIKSSGLIIHEFFSIDPKWGSLIFFIPTSIIFFYGLKAIGRSEKQVSFIMIIILVVLCVATFFNKNAVYSNILEANWDLSISLPIFNIAILIYMAQFIVPEMARGFKDKQERLPHAIILGGAITFVLVSLIPLSAIALESLAGVSQVVTLSWGKALGSLAFYVANIFAISAIATSYWGLGRTLISNIADLFRINIDSNVKNKVIITLISIIPPFILVILEYVDTIHEALYWPGIMSAVVLSVFPVILLNRSRKIGEKKPNYICNKFISNIVIQILVIATFIGITAFGVMVKFKILTL